MVFTQKQRKVLTFSTVALTAKFERGLLDQWAQTRWAGFLLHEAIVILETV